MEKAKQLVIYYIFKFRDKQEMKLQVNTLKFINFIIAFINYWNVEE